MEDGSPGKWNIYAQIMQPANSGPRHISVYNNILYTIHELSSTLTSQHIPILPANYSSLISNSSILPPGLPQGASMAAAEILIPPRSKSFPKSYIYVSNRNVGVQDPRGDSIAIFAFNRNTGKFKLVNQIFTGLDQIRGMEFGGEDSRYLIAGGVAGTAGVVIYERIDGGRNMQEVVRNTVIPTATSFIWTYASDA
jgi:6-phosphogluconolactonase (cycloisomerase 2 family)